MNTKVIKTIAYTLLAVAFVIIAGMLEAERIEQLGMQLWKTIIKKHKNSIDLCFLIMYNGITI